MKVVSENNITMTGCCSSSSAVQANVPFFKGENYNLWSLKMKTMFRSRDLWNLVEKGFSEEGDDNRRNESLKKDVKALYLIKQALDERVLIRISEATMAKKAWEISKWSSKAHSLLRVGAYTLCQEIEIYSKT